jgi:hypothetical protein
MARRIWSIGGRELVRSASEDSPVVRRFMREIRLYAEDESESRLQLILRMIENIGEVKQYICNRGIVEIYQLMTTSNDLFPEFIDLLAHGAAKGQRWVDEYIHAAMGRGEYWSQLRSWEPKDEHWKLAEYILEEWYINYSESDGREIRMLNFMWQQISTAMAEGKLPEIFYRAASKLLLAHAIPRWADEWLWNQLRGAERDEEMHPELRLVITIFIEQDSWPAFLSDWVQKSLHRGKLPLWIQNLLLDDFASSGDAPEYADIWIKDMIWRAKLARNTLPPKLEEGVKKFMLNPARPKYDNVISEYVEDAVRRGYASDWMYDLPQR